MNDTVKKNMLRDPFKLVDIAASDLPENKDNLKYVSDVHLAVKTRMDVIKHMKDFLTKEIKSCNDYVHTDTKPSTAAPPSEPSLSISTDSARVSAVMDEMRNINIESQLDTSILSGVVEDLAQQQCDSRGVNKDRPLYNLLRIVRDNYVAEFSNNDNCIESFISCITHYDGGISHHHTMSKGWQLIKSADDVAVEFDISSIMKLVSDPDDIMIENETLDDLTLPNDDSPIVEKPKAPEPEHLEQLLEPQHDEPMPSVEMEAAPVPEPPSPPSPPPKPKDMYTTPSKHIIIDEIVDYDDVLETAKPAPQPPANFDPTYLSGLLSAKSKTVEKKKAKKCHPVVPLRVQENEPVITGGSELDWSCLDNVFKFSVVKDTSKEVKQQRRLKMLKEASECLITDNTRKVIEAGATVTMPIIDAILLVSEAKPDAKYEQVVDKLYRKLLHGYSMTVPACNTAVTSPELHCIDDIVLEYSKVTGNTFHDTTAAMPLVFCSREEKSDKYEEWSRQAPSISDLSIYAEQARTMSHDVVVVEEERFVVHDPFEAPPLPSQESSQAPVPQPAESKTEQRVKRFRLQEELQRLLTNTKNNSAVEMPLDKILYHIGKHIRTPGETSVSELMEKASANNSGIIVTSQKIFLALCHLTTHVNNKNQAYAELIKIPEGYSLMMTTRDNDAFIISYKSGTTAHNINVPDAIVPDNVDEDQPPAPAPVEQPKPTKKKSKRLKVVDDE